MNSKGNALIWHNKRTCTGNNINNNGAVALSKALKTNTTLTELDLRGGC